jgi:hypothetical protein
LSEQQHWDAHCGPSECALIYVLRNNPRDCLIQSREYRESVRTRFGLVLASFELTCRRTKCRLLTCIFELLRFGARVVELQNIFFHDTIEVVLAAAIEKARRCGCFANSLATGSDGKARGNMSYRPTLTVGRRASMQWIAHFLPLHISTDSPPISETGLR